MPMRLLVLLFSIAMPVVAWFSQRGVFGPDNGTVSGQYPTLLVAAGYAFWTRPCRASRRAPRPASP
jgi:hypothetical protein